MLTVALKTIEREIYRSPLVLLAEHCCRPDHPLFHDSGPSNAHSIVFPLTSTRIIRGHRVVLENPTSISLYNEGEEYLSEAVSEEGTNCAWYTLEPGLLLEIVAGRTPRTQERTPFTAMQVPASAELTLWQRSLFRKASMFPRPDDLAMEEEVVALTDRIIAAATEQPQGMVGQTGTRIANRATEYLLANYLQPLSLAGIARELGTMPSYLSRTFRQTTGTTMHAFRQQLRLRRSLDLLPDCRGDFTRLAMDLGFSSHSHFTSRFHTTFGMTPSEFVGLSRAA